MMTLSEYRRKKALHLNAVIEKRLSRKLEQNLGWSDQTEVCWCIVFVNCQAEYFGMLSDAYRCFRNLAVQEPASDVETDADSVFSSAASVSSASSAGSSYSTRSVSRYRQRYGRGGRVYVDRTLTMDEKENLEKTDLKELLDPVREERWRFDPRACEDEKPVTIDEFSIQYPPSKHISLTSRQIAYRARLLPPRLQQTIPGTIRVSSGTMSSPLLTRPSLISPSTSRQSLAFQTPK